jgi:hypothetical protein
MASFLSKLLGLFAGSGSGPQSAVEETQTYADCTIYATPMREGAQLRLAGRIEKQVDGQVLVRTFIRADVFTDKNDAIDCTFRKARQIIDQNGPSLFSDGVLTRNA